MAMGIVIDPGHGGSNPGCAYGGMVEKDLALSIALEVYAELRRQRHMAVVTTRNADFDMSIADRVRMANGRGWPLVSIHLNADPKGEASGCRVFCRRIDTESGVLAESIARGVHEIYGRPGPSFAVPIEDAGGSRRVDEETWSRASIVRKPLGVAVNVEAAFLSHEEDRAWLARAGSVEALGGAIARGILSWLDVADRSRGMEATATGPAVRDPGEAMSINMELKPGVSAPIDMEGGTFAPQPLPDDCSPAGDPPAAAAPPDDDWIAFGRVRGSPKEGSSHAYWNGSAWVPMPKPVADATWRSSRTGRKLRALLAAVAAVLTLFGAGSAAALLTEHGELVAQLAGGAIAAVTALCAWWQHQHGATDREAIKQGLQGGR